jgi:SAM-dependent methyltransferase
MGDDCIAAQRTLADEPGVPREFARLQECGWTLPPLTEDGVYYFDPIQDRGISYPDEGLAVLGSDGGFGYWFDHRARVVAAQLQELGISCMFEVGAGTGAMASRLQTTVDTVVTVEPLRAGAKASADLGLISLCGTLEDLRLPTKSIEAIGAFDVLEHLEEPSVLIDEAKRVLRSGGIFIATVPAFSALWGDEDDVAEHHRRYTKRTLFEAFGREGFAPVQTEYLYATLVAPAALLRALPYRLGRRQPNLAVFSRMKSQLNVHPTLNRLAGAVLAIESAASRHVPLPFGLSLLGIFKAP